MKIVKYLPKIIIIEISHEQFNELMKKRENNSLTCEDKGLFIIEQKNGFTAVENSSGDMFTEDFKTRSGAYIWLSGLQDAEPIRAIENSDSWY